MKYAYIDTCHIGTSITLCVKNKLRFIVTFAVYRIYSFLLNHYRPCAAQTLRMSLLLSTAIEQLIIMEINTFAHKCQLVCFYLYEDLKIACVCINRRSKHDTIIMVSMRNAL